MDLINFLMEMLAQSWGWIVGIAAVVGLVVIFVIKVIKAFIAKVIAIAMIPIAGLTGGFVDTANHYWDEAQEHGTTVVKYVSDYVER